MCQRVSAYNLTRADHYFVGSLVIGRSHDGLVANASNVNYFFPSYCQHPFLIRVSILSTQTGRSTNFLLFAEILYIKQRFMLQNIQKLSLCVQRTHLVSTNSLLTSYEYIPCQDKNRC